MEATSICIYIYEYIYAYICPTIYIDICTYIYICILYIWAPFWLRLAPGRIFLPEALRAATRIYIYIYEYISTNTDR